MNPLPRHVAIIMDGNGRWANARGLPRVAGHREGVEAADRIVTACREMGIPYLTLYAFSDENWERPLEEVDQLMRLLMEFLMSKRGKMIRNGVRLRTIGETERLPHDVQTSLRATIDATAGGKNVTLILALSYGARAEICRAVTRATQAGASPITPELLSRYLDTADFPDPDLFIRTSGEYRISNYLLWQLEYTELYFTDILWPDFTPEHFRAALQAFRQRDRRYGRVPHGA